MITTILQNFKTVEAIVGVIIGLAALRVMWQVGYTRATERMASQWKGLYESELAGNVNIKTEFDRCKIEWQKTLDRLNEDVRESRESHRQLLELNKRLLVELEVLKRVVAENETRIDAMEAEMNEVARRRATERRIKE